jgi:hypothetical protein
MTDPQADPQTSARIGVVYLNSFDIECAICDRPWSYSPAGPSFGVPMYEDEILQDDDPGEWGGQPVCPRCYFVVRYLLTQHAGRLPRAMVRKAVQ